MDKLPPTPKVDLAIAKIVNDIQLAYADRIKAGDEVLSSFGISEIRELVQAEVLKARIDELEHIPYNVETNPHVNKRIAELQTQADKQEERGE